MGQSETADRFNIAVHVVETNATVQSIAKSSSDWPNLFKQSVNIFTVQVTFYCYVNRFHRTIQQIISSIRCNDLMTPVKRLANERNKLKNRGVDRTHSIYRDILFLAFVAIGRDNIDVQSFHREYAAVFEKLTMIERRDNLYQSQDLPPTSSALFCRAFFKPLLLLPWHKLFFNYDLRMLSSWR